MCEIVKITWSTGPIYYFGDVLHEENMHENLCVLGAVERQNSRKILAHVLSLHYELLVIQDPSCTPIKGMLTGLLTQYTPRELRLSMSLMCTHKLLKKIVEPICT